MGLSSEQRNRTERLINLVMDEENISRDEAVAAIHKFVCRGSCSWYRRSSREAGFDRLSLTTEERTKIKESINQVMKDLAVDEARAQIHKYICKR